MKTKFVGIVCVVVAMLTGCAGQPQTYYMDQSDGGSQAITFPNGTTFGGASGRQASSLAQIMVNSNNNNMKDYEALQATSNKDLQTTQEVLQTLQQVSQRQDALSSKNLQTSQHALQMLEHLSQHWGTGEVTLFFPTGSAALARSGEDEGKT